MLLRIIFGSPEALKAQQPTLFDLGKPDPTRGGKLRAERRLDRNAHMVTRHVRAESPKGESQTWQTKPPGEEQQGQEGEEKAAECKRCGGAMPKGAKGDTCDACSKTIDWLEQPSFHGAFG